MSVVLGFLLVVAAVVLVAGVYAWIEAVRVATERAAMRDEPVDRSVRVAWAGLESRAHPHAEPVCGPSWATCGYCGSTGHSSYYHAAP